MTTRQWDFLKESDTSLGMFYPLHYIVAGYGNMQAAREAEAAFRNEGKPREGARAATGKFVTDQLESRDEQSWLEHAEASMVKFVGTEMGYLQEDRNHALGGGAFLFVHTPDDDSLALAKRTFEHNPPVYARRYPRIAIEIIVENPKSL